ncbi:hypothetical protein GCM10022226_62460 [Sphaerisporangium flaviroseum]|uniref:Uncharacterized protein n=1 Tax=Sphaerisporangium flaviroseum TaxID=509199 RepID=A0ABP7J2L8_9ACTN
MAALGLEFGGAVRPGTPGPAWRHQHLASLGRYVSLGEETSAYITAEHDPAARRRSD